MELLITKCVKSKALIFSAFIWLGLPLAVFAQEEMEAPERQDTTIVYNNFFSVKQDEKITVLLDKYKQYNQKKDFDDGYRIQIMYTDVRDEVYRSKGATYMEFPELPSYVEYEQPYYKLRLGDFKTRLEATYQLHRVVPLYPGAFIVKDKIKIK